MQKELVPAPINSWDLRLPIREVPKKEDPKPGTGLEPGRSGSNEIRGISKTGPVTGSLMGVR